MTWMKKASLVTRIRRGWAAFRIKGCGCHDLVFCARHFDELMKRLDRPPRVIPELHKALSHPRGFTWINGDNYPNEQEV